MNDWRKFKNTPPHWQFCFSQSSVGSKETWIFCSLKSLWEFNSEWQGIGKLVIAWKVCSHRRTFWQNIQRIHQFKKSSLVSTYYTYVFRCLWERYLSEFPSWNGVRIGEESLVLWGLFCSTCAWRNFRKSIL